MKYFIILIIFSFFTLPQQALSEKINKKGEFVFTDGSVIKFNFIDGSKDGPIVEGIYDNIRREYSFKIFKEIIFMEKAPYRGGRCCGASDCKGKIQVVNKENNSFVLEQASIFGTDCGEIGYQYYDPISNSDTYAKIDIMIRGKNPRMIKKILFYE